MFFPTPQNIHIVPRLLKADFVIFEDFCWMCLGDWKTHGSEYYECSRYKENPDIVNQSQQAQAREALKKYLFYFERVGPLAPASHGGKWKGKCKYLCFVCLRCFSTISGRITTSLCSWRLRLTTGYRKRSRKGWWTTWGPGSTGSTCITLQSFWPRYRHLQLCLFRNSFGTFNVL